MTWEEMTRRLENAERRLDAKETALNAALKELDELKKSGQIGVNRTIKNAIEPEVYNYLFSYCYDNKSGEPCECKPDRKLRNFQNLCNNVMMACGYTYSARNSKDGNYYAKVTPISGIPENEYEDFRKLLQDITALIYTFKANRAGGNK